MFEGFFFVKEITTLTEDPQNIVCIFYAEYICLMGPSVVTKKTHVVNSSHGSVHSLPRHLQGTCRSRQLREKTSSFNPIWVRFWGTEQVDFAMV